MKTTFPRSLLLSPHDLSHPGADAARVQVPVAVGSPAEDAFLDKHREPGLAQGFLQGCGVPAGSWMYWLLSQVTCTVPSL